MDLEWKMENQEAWLTKLFDWLYRNRMGVRSGSRPIGWVQQHNMAAYERIVALCIQNRADVKAVRVWSGELFAGKTRLAGCQEIFDHADKVCRGGK